VNTLIRTLTAVGLALVGAGAGADERIDRSLPAAADGRVEISNVSGEIRVYGTDDDEVHLRAEVGDGVEEVIFEADGERIVIRVEMVDGARHGGSVEMDVSVPRGSALDIDAVSSDVTVRDVDGRLVISTLSGDIELATGSRDLEVGTMSGDVGFRGDDQDGIAALSSVSGDVVMRGFSGEIRSESVSGDVEAVLGTARRIRAQSTSGDVRITAALTPDARVDMETVSGEVGLSLAGGRAGEYRLETFSGDLENCFGPEPEERRWSMGSTLEFREGDGGATVNLSSMSGSVQLCD
jgi:DUF4097 and DUF4098 domain-containing protein YvlB